MFVSKRYTKPCHSLHASYLKRFGSYYIEGPSGWVQNKLSGFQHPPSDAPSAYLQKYYFQRYSQIQSYCYYKCYLRLYRRTNVNKTKVNNLMSSKLFGLVRTSAGFMSPRTLLKTTLPLRTHSCNHQHLISKCLSLPNPVREAIDLAAELSTSNLILQHHPRSRMIDCMPSASLAALTKA